MVHFSIITINKNNAQGLEKTIRSVINQICKDFEFLIIDGKSTDESVSKIKQFETSISFWTSEEDQGIYSAMNKAIKRAKGEYCLFLNSGDFFFNENVLKEIAELNCSEDIIAGDVVRISDFHNKQEVFSKITHSEITLFDLFSYSLNHQATFFRTSLFFQFGFYEEKYKVISDWIFSIKAIVINNVSFKYINKTICYYNEDGISNSSDNYYIQERIPALRELIPQRILRDYEVNFNNEFLRIYNRLKKYTICRLILRTMNYLVLKYETVFITKPFRDEY